MSDVTDNKADSRFELTKDGHVAFAAYRLEGERILFTHTVVPPELSGHGIGGQLVGAALADVERRGLRVVPLCSFVRAYIDKHPETRSLLAEG
jgi:predicted GNAT family acetyltransferase